VKSSLSFWLAAAAIVSLSLAPKIVLGALRVAAPPAPTRAERLRTFLTGVSDGPVTAIGGGKLAPVIDGWRFETAGCAASAFPSGPRGTFDIAASDEAHIMPGSRTAYVYRGAVSPEPPTWRVAQDVIAFRAISGFLPAKRDEPGYTVLVFPNGCAAAIALPWSRFRSD
jgi:hypothetical protein